MTEEESIEFERSIVELPDDVLQTIATLVPVRDLGSFMATHPEFRRNAQPLVKQYGPPTSPGVFTAQKKQTLGRLYTVQHARLPSYLRPHIPTREQLDAIIAAILKSKYSSIGFSKETGVQHRPDHLTFDRIDSKSIGTYIRYGRDIPIATRYPEQEVHFFSEFIDGAFVFTKGKRHLSNLYEWKGPIQSSWDECLPTHTLQETPRLPVEEDFFRGPGLEREDALDFYTRLENDQLGTFFFFTHMYIVASLEDEYEEDAAIYDNVYLQALKMLVARDPRAVKDGIRVAEIERAEADIEGVINAFYDDVDAGRYDWSDFLSTFVHEIPLGYSDGED